MQKNIFKIYFLFFFWLGFSPLELFAQREELTLLSASSPPYDHAFQLELGYFRPLGYYAKLINDAPMLKGAWRYNPKWWENFVLEIDAGFAFSDFKNNADAAYRFMPFSAQGVYLWPLDTSWSLAGSLGFGYYLMEIEGEQFRNFHAKGGLVLQLELSYNLKAYLKTELYALQDARESLWASGTFLGFSYALGEPLAEKDIKVTSVETEKIFTALYPSYYQENVGVIQLENTSGEELLDLRVSVWVSEYMENKSLSPFKPAKIEKNQKILVPLYLYFSGKIKQLGSELYTTATLELEYRKKNGVKYRKKENLKIKIYGRNALVWDNLHKLGSFISYNDPAIFNFTRRILSIPVREEGHFSSASLLQIMKVVEGLKLYRLTYVKDPETPYESFSSQKAMVDNIQYPRETLLRKTGDCDDLTVLLSAMLESIGINTAFVSVPGHIFLLVEAPGAPFGDKLITYQGRHYLPLESTRIKEGFNAALSAGYENYLGASEREIVTAALARAKYSPLTFEEPLEIPFAYQELPGKVKEALEQISLHAEKRLSEEELSKMTEQELNRKGVGYSRIGLFKEAERVYRYVLSKYPRYHAPYYNLVTLYALDKKYGEAQKIVEQFERQFGTRDLKMQEVKKNLLRVSTLESDKKSHDNEKLDLLLLRAYY